MIEILENSTEYYKICRTAILPLNEQLNTTRDLLGNENEQSESKKMKEDSFEKYHIEHNLDCPSRMSSLFICSFEMVPLWIKKLTQFRPPFTVLRLELTGRVFWADAHDYDDDNISNYWKGSNPTDRAAFIEGVFEGDFKSIEECTEKFKING